MPYKSAIFSALVALALQSGSALAHPSLNILQAGGAKGERVALTGVQHKHEANVSVYRGRAALLGDEPVKADKKRQTVKVILAGHGHTCHPAVRLRTQGFFARTSQPYAFTQGFYSGQRIRRR